MPRPTDRQPTSRARRAWGAVGGVAAVLAAVSALAAARMLQVLGADSPRRFESQVADIERTFEGDADRGKVLLSGSSFFERWTTSTEDLAPLDTENIGIGGTKVGDHLHFFDRMVLPRAPRALVLYIGSNDISGLPIYTKTAEETVALVLDYVRAARRALPGTRVYYVAITEAPARARVREDIRRANSLLAAAASSEGFTFIPTADDLLREDGEIDGSLFGPDHLHFNEKGYTAFAAAVRRGLQPEFDAMRERSHAS
jgi:lysophospholipase L1-like esterase